MGAVSVWPHVSGVPPAGTLPLRAPLLPVLVGDTVSRDVFCHPAAPACGGTCVVPHSWPARRQGGRQRSQGISLVGLVSSFLLEAKPSRNECE